MICPNCGKEVSDSAKFCRFCGISLSSINPGPTGESDTQVQSGIPARPDPPTADNQAKAPKINPKTIIPIIGSCAALLIICGLYFGLRGGASSSKVNVAVPSDTAVSSAVMATTTPTESQEPMEENYLQLIDVPLPNADPADVFPNRALKDSELEGLNAKQIQHMVNTIFAKNSYSFHTPEALKFFKLLPWYSDLYSDQSVITSNLSNIDDENLDLLISYRNNLDYDPNSITGIDELWTNWYTDQLLTPEMIESMSDYDLALLANTIFAKNGYIFSDSDLNSIFSAQEWYNGSTHNYDDIAFSSIDIANLELIGSQF
jgi:hypothetical protein